MWGIGVQHTLLQPIVEPCLVEHDRTFRIDHAFALKGDFDANLPSVLLAEQGSDHRAGQLTEFMSSDVVGDAKQGERMQLRTQTIIRGLVRRDERIGVGDRHGEPRLSASCAGELRRVKWWIKSRIPV